MVSKAEPIMNFLSLWIVIYSYVYILNIMPYNTLILQVGGQADLGRQRR